MAYNPNVYNPYGSQAVNGLTSVTGIEGARAYPLPPNSVMPLFDANEDMMYVKSTDGAGFPTVKIYRFEEVQPEVEQSPDYVSRDEFDKLNKKLDKLIRGMNGKQPVSE